MRSWKSSEEQAPSGAAVDEGLRSAQGIRWLLLAGAMVVAVSVVRLVAAEWGGFGPCTRFLALVVGALAVYAAGDVTRNRLRLPVAGSAFLFLFTGIVPLLAWGAAHFRLLEAPFGWLCLIPGLGSLLICVDRVLRGVLDYRDRFYPIALGTFLFAMPILPFLEARWGDAESFFVTVAGSLGLLLRAASRHVNRIFFHRDRVHGVERTVHWLPFAVLVLVYVAGLSLLEGFGAHLALALVFVALALIDAGEEYYQALVRVAGPQERWPRRSLVLLTLGFSALATSLAIAPFDSGGLSLALVAAIATLRLLSWAGRYRSSVAHAAGLLVGIVAYHTFPALAPDVVLDLFKATVRALGFDPHGVAGVSFGDLGMVAALLALAWFLRQRLTLAMTRAHCVVATLAASLLLMVSLLDPAAARLVAPACGALLLGGLVALRWKGLLPVIYQALVTSAVAWSWPAISQIGLDGTRLAVLLGVVQLGFLGGGLLVLRRRGKLPPGEGMSALLTWPPLAVALMLIPVALHLLEKDLTAGGLMLLVAAETFLLTSAITRHNWLFTAAAVLLFAWVPIQSASLESYPSLWLTGMGWLGFGAMIWAGAEVSKRHDRREQAQPLLMAAAISFAAAGAASIWDVAFRGGVLAGGALWQAVLPGFLASLCFAFLPATGNLRKLSASVATGTFALSCTVLLARLDSFARELYWLGPGLALIGLSVLLRREIGETWQHRLFTAGAACLYAMPMLGLLESLSWIWQTVLLLLAVAFGAASFRLRSRSLLTVSTAALVIDLACFLIRLRQTAPLLVWVAGIAFGLGLMALAGLLEHRREILLQRIRIWGQELRSWA